jgi:hypothetical protein
MDAVAGGALVAGEQPDGGTARDDRGGNRLKRTALIANNLAVECRSENALFDLLMEVGPFGLVRGTCLIEAGRLMKNNFRWRVDLGTHRSTDQMEAHA